MGKKPVASLVGLCWLSLAVSGCKDCGCGDTLWSRKEKTPTPVAGKYQASPAFNSSQSAKGQAWSNRQPTAQGQTSSRDKVSRIDNSGFNSGTVVGGASNISPVTGPGRAAATSTHQMDWQVENPAVTPPASMQRTTHGLSPVTERVPEAVQTRKPAGMPQTGAPVYEIPGSQLAPARGVENLPPVSSMEEPRTMHVPGASQPHSMPPVIERTERGIPAPIHSEMPMAVPPAPGSVGKMIPPPPALPASGSATRSRSSADGPSMVPAPETVPAPSSVMPALEEGPSFPPVPPPPGPGR